MTRTRSGPYWRDTALHYLHRLTQLRVTRAGDLAAHWQGIGSAVVGTLQPPAGLLARGIVHRSSLEDTDPDLIDALRQAGAKWGPLGVAITAAHLTDPDVLAQCLRQGDRAPRVPITGWDLEPDQRRSILRDTLLNHHLQRRNWNGPIDGCECGDLRLGQGWSDHVADVILEGLERGRAVTSTDPLPTPEPADQP